MHLLEADKLKALFFQCVTKRFVIYTLNWQTNAIYLTPIQINVIKSWHLKYISPSKSNTKRCATSLALVYMPIKIPFVAMPNDGEQRGRAAWNRCHHRWRINRIIFVTRPEFHLSHRDFFVCGGGGSNCWSVDFLLPSASVLQRKSQIFTYCRSPFQ